MPVGDKNDWEEDDDDDQSVDDDDEDCCRSFLSLHIEYLFLHNIYFMPSLTFLLLIIMVCLRPFHFFILYV